MRGWMAAIIENANEKVANLVPGGMAAALELGRRGYPYFGDQHLGMQRVRPAEGDPPEKKIYRPAEKLLPCECSIIEKNLILEQSGDPEGLRATYDALLGVTDEAFASTGGHVRGPEKTDAAGAACDLVIANLRCRGRTELLPALIELFAIDFEAEKASTTFCAGSPAADLCDRMAKLPVILRRLRRCPQQAIAVKTTQPTSVDGGARLQPTAAGRY